MSLVSARSLTSCKASASKYYFVAAWDYWHSKVWVLVIFKLNLSYRDNPALGVTFDDLLCAKIFFFMKLSEMSSLKDSNARTITLVLAVSILFIVAERSFMMKDLLKSWWYYN